MVSAYLDTIQKYSFHQISLAPLALAPPARLICLSHVFSRRLRCEHSMLDTRPPYQRSTRHLSDHAHSLCVSLRRTFLFAPPPLFNRVLGSWHPDLTLGLLPTLGLCPASLSLGPTGVHPRLPGRLSSSRGPADLCVDFSSLSGER
jgi:hypothetical protein